MRNKPKVSIIVPVYNVEEYLVKCLDSLVSQTLKEIEIICINDGSTDNSLEILNTFAQKDSRIIIINKQNEGVSAARNIGLDISNGEYIMFVDSDDYLEIQTCQTVYEKIKNENSDLLIFNYFSVTQNTKKISAELDNILTNKFSFKQCPDSFFYTATSVWGKLYKNKDLGNFNTRLKKGEDTVFFWIYCLRNNPIISILNIPLYNYRIRNNGAMSNIGCFQNSEIFKSIKILKNSPYFKNTTNNIKARILDRYAKSLCYELKIFCCKTKISKKYINNLNKFINELNNYDVKNLYYLKKLKQQLYKIKYKKLLNFANKIFYITNKDRHKVINICGIKIKFEYYKKEQAKKEHDYINRITRENKRYQKNSYLLFDALHDSSVECIDAYSLFKYMQSIGKKAYYVIPEESELYKQLERQGDLKYIISLKNSTLTNPGDFLEEVFPVLLQCKAIITSFGENSHETNKFFKTYQNWQYFFIQHGQVLIPDRVFETEYLYPEKFDKFLVSSENEYNIFKKYGWQNDKLLKAGLPRWDLLSNAKPKEHSILIMFTWRRHNLLSFEESLYKKNLSKFLNNKDLQKYLKDNNVKLYFAPHHALKHNQGINFDINNENIEIVNTNQISQYIKKCSCLVTDFSSVSFDFMFQEKPVLFYILDKNDNTLNPIEKRGIDTFDYKKFILPNVFFNEDEVISKLKHYVENNFELELINKEKYDKFFYTKENIRQKLVEEIDRCCD